ncbi:hypothetical protein [Treponema pectinovorum]|uniref:hypothetical protein n=1 Tax=Treponema pectinovorum TaxID=164 RepID=UPI0011CC8559|nr:hypothetical protein [Treponema pectinovorum]
MKFTSQKRYWFIPDIFGNLTLDEKEQIQIEIIRATVENQGELSKVSVKKSEDGSISADSKFNVSKILRDHVGEIKNLTVDEYDEYGEVSSVQIQNGKELAESSFYGSKTLCDMICVEVASDRLTESEKKILK